MSDPNSFYYTDYSNTPNPGDLYGQAHASSAHISASDMYQSFLSPPSHENQASAFPTQAYRTPQGSNIPRRFGDRTTALLPDGSLNKVPFKYGDKTLYLCPRPPLDATSELKARVFDDAVAVINASLAVAACYHIVSKRKSTCTSINDAASQTMYLSLQRLLQII